MFLHAKKKRIYPESFAFAVQFAPEGFSLSFILPEKNALEQTELQELCFFFAVQFAPENFF